MSDKETAEMIKKTAVSALEREKYINGWTNASGIKSDPVLKQFGINADLKMIDLDGRVLKAPDLQYGQNRKILSDEIGEKGSWNHASFKFQKVNQVDTWMFVDVSGQLTPQNQDALIDSLISVGRSHGIIISDRPDFKDLSTYSYLNNEKRILEFKKTIDGLLNTTNLQLLVAVLPGTSRAYNVIKTCGDIEHGVATQCLDATKFFKNRQFNLSPQTISNILLKINSKLEGKNFVLSKQNLNFGKYLSSFWKNPLMIFGADVTHPSPGEETITESIAAVVGSLDQDCSYYASRLYAQSKPKSRAYETIHDLDKMFYSLLKEFFNINQTYPDRKSVV